MDQQINTLAKYRSYRNNIKRLALVLTNGKMYDP